MAKSKAFTKEQLAKVVEVYNTSASIQEAADKLGLTRPTVGHHLRRARALYPDLEFSFPEERISDRIMGVAEAAAKYENPDKIRLEKQIKELRERNDILEKKLELAEKHAELAAAKAAKTIKKHRARKKRGDFIQAIVPDFHGSRLDMEAVSAMFHDLEAIKPRRIIHLGDGIDCGGFLAEHHTMGYVAETLETFEQDIALANWFWDEIYKIAPNAEIDYIEGNHERRIETWCVTKALRKGPDAQFLLDRLSPRTLLNLDKRGISYFRQGEFYDGLPINGTIKRGKCHYTHGWSTAMHAAAAHLKKCGGNIVYGHTHRADFASSRTLVAGVVGAWSPGCLSIKQPLWRHTDPTEWSHGYGLQIMSENGEFLTIQVPIIDGHSLLSPLLDLIT